MIVVRLVKAAEAGSLELEIGTGGVTKLDIVDLAALGSGALVNGIGLFPAYHAASLLPALKVRIRVRVGLHGTAGCPVGSYLPTT
jgi:hypothetical protein